MPGKRLQYQSRADVLSTSKERVTVDRWIGEAPQRIFQKATISRAILAGCLFWCSTIAPETITVDKWQGSRPDIVFQVKPGLSRAIQAGSCFLGDIPRVETTSLDRWQLKLPDVAPRPLTRRQPVDTPFVWNPPPSTEVVTLDKWQGSRPDIIFQKPGLSKAVQSGSCFLGDTRPETVSLDRWQGSYPDIVRAASRRQPADAPFVWSPPVAEVVTLDKWFVDRPAYIFQKAGLSRAIQSGSCFLGDAFRSSQPAADAATGLTVRPRSFTTVADARDLSDTVPPRSFIKEVPL